MERGIFLKLHFFKKIMILSILFTIFVIIQRIVELLTFTEMEITQKKTFILFFTYSAIYFVILIMKFYKGDEGTNDVNKYAIISLFLISLAIRIFFAIRVRGFPSDVACFIYWGEIASKSIRDLYKGNVFIDYPPLYILLLGLLMKINVINDKIMTIKLPSVICDIILGILLLNYYKNKKLSQKESVALVSIFFLFNPVTMLNSSLWGQCDSVLTLLIVLSFLLYEKNKQILSIVISSLAILVKPQAIFYVLVLFTVLTVNAYISEQYILLVKQVVAFFIPFILVTFLLKPAGDYMWLLKLYLQTVNEYPYTSLNALNLYTFLKMNWQPIANVHKVISYILVVTIMLIVTVSIINEREKGKVRVSNELIVLNVIVVYLVIFAFSVGMHERYNYIPIMLLPFVYSPKKKSLFLLFSFLSMIHIFNTLAVLIISQNNQFFLNIGITEQTLSIINITTTLYFLIRYRVIYKKMMF
jgi:Gpi18-like mannosyltransferase